MALYNTYGYKNIVADQDFKEDVNTRIVTVSGVNKTVACRRATKNYQYIGLSRSAADLCVRAKLAQYYRSRTYVSDNGVLVTEPAKCLANVIPNQLAGDDWSVEVQVNEEDELFFPTAEEAGHSPVVVDDALYVLRANSYDNKVVPLGFQVDLPWARYGTDQSIAYGADMKGFILLPEGFSHSCFDAQYVAQYEYGVQWMKGEVPDGSWTTTTIRDAEWTSGGIRFIGIPTINSTDGEYVYMRVRVRAQNSSRLVWYSNVVCQHWGTGNANIVIVR